MAQDNKILVSWLKDAHSMEKALVPVLENHAKDAKGHPELQSRIEQHVAETKQHAQIVEDCLNRLGTDTSGLKDAVGRVTGGMNSVATAPFGDELVKDGLADFATENMEIAAYNALITAANELGDTRTAEACQQILRDEQDMARFLAQHLPMAVHEAVAKSETRG